MMFRLDRSITHTASQFFHEWREDESRFHSFIQRPDRLFATVARQNAAHAHDTFPLSSASLPNPSIHPSSGSNHLCVLDNGRLETLCVLDIHGLDVAVQFLLGTLLVVTLSGDADAETEGDALDAGFPDLLVELGVEADVGCTLNQKLANILLSRQRVGIRNVHVP